MSGGYHSIVAHYERCLERHGDSHLGVDWPNKADVETRYRVMLEVIRPGTTERVELLDFGCGAAPLLEYMRRYPEFANVEYTASTCPRGSSSCRAASIPELASSISTCSGSQKPWRSSITS
jgi:hypothetical protein